MMNTKNFFLLKIGLGAGLFLAHFGLYNNSAYAVSLKYRTTNSSLENLLTTDFDVEEEYTLIPLSEPLSIWDEIKSENLPLTEAIGFQIETYQEQPEKLLTSLITSLQGLEFDQNIGDSGENTVQILSQTGYEDIYQDIYDFETELTNDFQQQPENNLQRRADNRQPSDFFEPSILSYTYTSDRSITNYLENTTSQISTLRSLSQESTIPLTTSSYYTGSTSSSQQGYSVQNLSNLNGGITGLQSQYGVSNNFSLPSREIAIETTNFNNIKLPSIQKTPEQIELEEKLEKQREQMEKRIEKLKEKLEKDREKREQQRAKEQEKRAREQQKRLAQMRKLQEKSRNR